MEFGIWSNGFRPHESAHRSYDEDIAEIVLADQLGYEVAYISEHHGEAPYINRVDTIPAPDLMMCKAAGLTQRIRMGAAVKLIHLYHPLDVAIQAAVTDHLIGDDRYIFGFGSGFPLALLSNERGLGFEDRHERLYESLDFILKCWTEDAPFDWDGTHWKGEGVISLPKPLAKPHPRMATATESDPMLKICGERGYTLLSAFLEPADMLREKAVKYAAAGYAAGRMRPRSDISASRIVYVADSREQAIDDLRDAVAFETQVQGERGFLKMLEKLYGLVVPPDRNAIDALAESGLYILGEPDQVAEEIEAFFHTSGGFGTFLYVTGKDWATREKRERSLTRFMEEVAPQLRDLEPAETAA